MQLRQAVGHAIACGVDREIVREVVLEQLFHHPCMGGVDGLLLIHGRAGDNPVEIVGEALRLRKRLTTTGRAAFELRVARAPIIVGPNDGLGRVGKQMHGPVPEVDLRLPVVERERRQGLRPAVVPGIAVGDSVSLSEPVIEEIQISIFTAIAPLHEATVPRVRKRQLHVIVDRR